VVGLAVEEVGTSEDEEVDNSVSEDAEVLSAVLVAAAVEEYSAVEVSASKVVEEIEDDSDSDAASEVTPSEEEAVIVSEPSADVIDGVFAEVVSELPVLPLVVVAEGILDSVAEMSELEDSTSIDASDDATEEPKEVEELDAEGLDEVEGPNGAEEPDEA
jgi:hypothetical protein